MSTTLDTAAVAMPITQTSTTLPPLLEPGAARDDGPAGERAVRLRLPLPLPHASVVRLPWPFRTTPRFVRERSTLFHMRDVHVLLFDGVPPWRAWTPHSLHRRWHGIRMTGSVARGLAEPVDHTELFTVWQEQYIRARGLAGTVLLYDVHDVATPGDADDELQPAADDAADATSPAAATPATTTTSAAVVARPHAHDATLPSWRVHFGVGLSRLASVRDMTRALELASRAHSVGSVVAADLFPDLRDSRVRRALGPYGALMALTSGGANTLRAPWIGIVSRSAVHDPLWREAIALSWTAVADAIQFDLAWNDVSSVNVAVGFIPPPLDDPPRVAFFWHGLLAADFYELLDRHHHPGMVAVLETVLRAMGERGLPQMPAYRFWAHGFELLLPAPLLAEFVAWSQRFVAAFYAKYGDPSEPVAPAAGIDGDATRTQPFHCPFMVPYDNDACLGPLLERAFNVWAVLHDVELRYAVDDVSVHLDLQLNLWGYSRAALLASPGGGAWVGGFVPARDRSKNPVWVTARAALKN